MRSVGEDVAANNSSKVEEKVRRGGRLPCHPPKIPMDEQLDSTDNHLQSMKSKSKVESR